MELKYVLRNDFNKKIKNLIIKDKCEVCGKSYNLEVHHKYAFINLLKDTLNELNLPEYKNREDYSDIELKNIREKMLGKQLNCEYSTLCSDCHKIADEHFDLNIRKRNKDELLLLKCGKHITHCIEKSIVRLDEIIHLELNQCILKDDFMNLFRYLINDHGEPWGIRKIKTELENAGYKIISKKKTLNKKRVRVYIIMKNN